VFWHQVQELDRDGYKDVDPMISAIRRHVAFIIYPQFTLIDLSGPWFAPRIKTGASLSRRHGKVPAIDDSANGCFRAGLPGVYFESAVCVGTVFSTR
jgi:hypothetical protein